MLRPLPNHMILRLPNDVDGCMNPHNVPDCYVQQLHAFHLSQQIPMLNLIKYRIFLCSLFLITGACILFMYFCQINKFLQSFLTKICLGSPGVDGISPKILKETVEQSSTPLAHVFNVSLHEGIVPLEWKEANIIPLFKKYSRNKYVDYRPVSLTSVICKLLETIIRYHMMDFLIKRKLINPSQHWFLKARSCLTNVLYYLEEITKWMDEGSPVDVTYLDFLKEFDKVPHQRLILKLKSNGMGNSILDWIEQWLTDRRQRVVVDG